MAFVEIEGTLLNTDDIIAVRRTVDPDFQSEVVLVSGVIQLLHMSVKDAKAIIEAAK